MRFLLPLVLLCALVGTSEALAGTRLQVRNRRIERNQTLSQALYAAELTGNEVATVLGALEGVFDFRKSRVGDQFRVVRREGALELFDYRRGPLDEWLVRREGEKWVGSRRTVEVRKEVALVSLEVSSSLYEATLAAGESPDIAMVLADVFAWDIDFYREFHDCDIRTLRLPPWPYFVARGLYTTTSNPLAQLPTTCQE
jgi:hypothetical protein